MNQPMYQQIKHYIEQKIDSGYWSVGHKIETELELTERFQVSRMTVNKAIRDLVTEGRLIRKPRLGTFVCESQEKAESPLLDIQNIAEEVKLRGKTYSSKVLKQCATQADEQTATKLGVMLNAKVYYSEIIHFEDELPIQLEVRWVNAAYVPDYVEQDFSQMTPNQYLSENCPLSAIEHTVEAIAPTTEVVDAIQLAANEPCLLLNRRTWSQDRLISTAQLFHPATRYKLSSKILLS